MRHGELTPVQNTIKNTIALQEVPMESYYLGAAGTLPYLAMSMSTVYLSYCINNAPAFGSYYLVTPQTAHELLAMIEPIEIGFGASVSPIHSPRTGESMTPRLTDPSDPLLPWRHPLGPRIRRLRRASRLPAIHHRRGSAGRGMAHDADAL